MVHRATAGRLLRRVTCALLCAGLLGGCAGSLPGGTAAGPSAAPSAQPAEQPSAAPAQTPAPAANPAAVPAELPVGDWQAAITLPDWSGGTDPALAVNHLYSFAGYAGQGVLYLTPTAGLTSFSLYINGTPVDTAAVTAAGGKSWAVDFSGAAVNGTNSLQISGVQPAGAGVQVHIPYPTVQQGTPEQVGIRSGALDAIGEIVQADIRHGFPGAQMAVIKDGRLVFQGAWGSTNAYRADGSPNPDSPAVTNDTLYDLASNTKMYAVNYAVQYLVSQGRLNLDSTVVSLLGDRFAADTVALRYPGAQSVSLEQQRRWKAGITLRQLLCHQAGFPADPRYNADDYDPSTGAAAAGAVNPLYSGSDGSAATRAATLGSICKTPLLWAPGTKVLYSDVDYMLLGFVVETVTGQRLDDFLAETFWRPLGLSRITYNPLQNGFTAADCAATELNGNTRGGTVSFTGIRTATIQGQVHDEKAYYAMGGVSGHAGLFASAGDLARLAFLMLNGGSGSHAFFTPAVLDTFTAPNAVDHDTEGLGWRRQGAAERSTTYGVQAGRGTVGHTGWTGTLTLIDPDQSMVLVYLTNKINTPLTNPAADQNQFNGNWYTSASLGFAAQLLYQGLNPDTPAAAGADTALLTDMALDKISLAAGNAHTAAHPAAQAAYALAEVVFDRAEAERTAAAVAGAGQVLAALDPTRDAAELAALRPRLERLGG